MKKISILIIICLSAQVSWSQKRGLSADKIEKMEKLKQAFIMLELELEEKKAAEFKSIYEAYENERKDMRDEAMKLRTERMAAKEKAETNATPKKLTEKEALAKLNSHLEHEQARIDLEKKYLDQMVASIGALKVLEYKTAEREFRRELMHMYKDDKHQHHMEKELMERRKHMHERGLRQ